MIRTALVAADQSGVGHSILPFFLICTGAFVLFVAVVAGAATASRAREDRREGRTVPNRRARRQADGDAGAGARPA